MIQLNSCTIQEVRKEYNLDKPGIMDQAIDILHDWIQKQDHFVKKDFCREYLERIIISTKGSVEKAKTRLDKLCTMRSMVPSLFEKCHATNDFPNLRDSYINVNIPKITDDNYRIFILKINKKPSPSVFREAYQYTVLDGYGFRIKGIYVLSNSSVVSVFMDILKQILSAKIGQRVSVCKTPESLQQYLPKHLLPEDYGGEQESILTLYDKWTEELSSEKNVAYMKEMREACTNEKLRRTDKFNEEYLGMPGSFKMLSVD